MKKGNMHIVWTSFKYVFAAFSHQHSHTKQKFNDKSNMDMGTANLDPVSTAQKLSDCFISVLLMTKYCLDI